MKSVLPRGTLPVLFKKASAGAPVRWEIWVERNVIVTEYGRVDGKQQTLTETIKEGKNAGRKNATTPEEQAVAEAIARWNKQKDRKAYGESVEESGAIRSAMPMLAKVYERFAKEVQWGSAAVQPKLDGFRCLAKKVDEKQVVLTSREGQPFFALGHIEAALVRVMKVDQVLDGEIYSHDLSLNQISSGCKRKSELSEKLAYWVYDVVSPDSFWHRSEQVRKTLADAGVPGLVRVPTVMVRSPDELRRCEGEFLSQCFEGAMLRWSDAGYEAGKRSIHLLKCKTFDSGEFVVRDFKTGRGKLANAAIFVCETDEGAQFDCLAPGTLGEKAEYAKNGEKYVGKFLEVKFANWTNTEKSVPFQPIGLRFRAK